MKILHVISQLTKGGAERVAVELANGFSRSGDEVAMLVTHPIDPALLQHMLDPAVDVSFVTSRPRGRAVTYAAALAWLIRNRKFVLTRDIIHVHLTFGSVFGIFASILRKLARRRTPKVVETYHAVGMAMPSLKRRLHMALAATRDGMVSLVTDPVLRQFRESHPDLLFAVIPNGVTFDEADPSAEERRAYRRSLGVPADAKVVGTIGRLVPDRSPARIVEVFAEIAKLSPEAHYLIGGDGSQARHVAQLASGLGLADRLIMPGLVTRLAETLSILDLYVTLNVGAETGVAGMEAAAAGVPIVALQLDPTYRPSGDEWIFSSQDPRQLGKAAVDLLADDAGRGALARCQSEYARSRHSVEAMLCAYRIFYESLRS